VSKPSELYAITDAGGYVFLGTPSVSLVEDGFLVLCEEAAMRADMTLVGLELRWGNGNTSSTWMDDPVTVFPGSTFTGRLTIQIDGQLVGPLLRAFGV